MAKSTAKRVFTVVTPVAASSLSPEFVQKFVRMVRVLEAAKTGKYANTKGIHTVYDGVNAELKAKGLDPIATIAGLEAIGVIEGHFVRGGRRIFVKGEMPVYKSVTKATGLLD